MPSRKRQMVYVLHFRFKANAPWYTHEYANAETARLHMHNLRSPYEAFLLEGTPDGHGKHEWRTLEYMTD